MSDFRWSDDQILRFRPIGPNQTVGKTKPSPIRMRMEIVGGIYGPVTVERELYTGKVLVHTDPIASAEELREAAHIFNQIAEALEDNAK